MKSAPARIRAKVWGSPLPASAAAVAQRSRIYNGNGWILRHMGPYWARTCRAHLRHEWAHSCHICAGTGLTPSTSGLAASETGLTPATSAPGLGCAVKSPNRLAHPPSRRAAHCRANPPPRRWGRRATQARVHFAAEGAREGGRAHPRRRTEARRCEYSEHPTVAHCSAPRRLKRKRSARVHWIGRKFRAQVSEVSGAKFPRRECSGPRAVRAPYGCESPRACGYVYRSVYRDTYRCIDVHRYIR